MFLLTRALYCLNVPNKTMRMWKTLVTPDLRFGKKKNVSSSTKRGNLSSLTEFDAISFFKNRDAI